MNYWTFASIPLVFFVLWLYTAQVVGSFPTLRGKRICLLIAHPDDEAMFFAPVTLALTKPELGNHMKILSLSSGNADGIGKIRKKELVKSGRILGLRRDEDILVLDDPNFQDSPTATWSSAAISTLLTKTFAPTLASTPSTDAPTTTIDVLLTFDPSGISSHPNHMSLYHGSLRFLHSLTTSHPGWTPPIALYALTTTSILRKYMSVLDAPLTMGLAAVLGKKENGEAPTPLLAVSGFGDYWRARRAMVEAHASQMRWFRWGWITVGRYMVVNDLRKVKV